MCGLKIEAFAGKICFVILTVICIQMEVIFSFCIVYLSFFESETSLNSSSFADQLDFVENQNFNSNDVIVTSFDVISLLTRCKF